MPKKLQSKKYQKYTSWWRFGGGVTTLILAGLLAICGGIMTGSKVSAKASDCHDLMVVFARGSGAEKDTNENYLEFKNQIENIIKNSEIDRAYYDLDYEAKGIGVDNIWTLVGAFFGAGDAYDFGASVDEGVSRLTNMVSSCPESKFVLGGYSQGAMVVSQAVHSIDASKVVYAATFGDPKIYLPEGKAWGSLSVLSGFTGTEKNLLRTGVIPEACRGANLSDYRMYVPDCYAYEGMLGSYRPYEPLGYAGKLGTWCNKYDMFCSSYLSASSHTSYIEDGLYLDAAKVIGAKVAEAFGTKLNFVSSHDTAILIDSSWSMRPILEDVKTEALKLAQKTLESGGRVALYDYRDLSDGYSPVKHCDFETCTLAIFERELEKIEGDGGEDDPESLLGSSMHVMKELNWKQGATKSLVTYTDATYHDPDFDHTSVLDVIALSKKIDPVNFYVVLPYDKADLAENYKTLVEGTDGAVAFDGPGIEKMYDFIVARYDSLPRVEEETDFDTDVPMLEVTETMSGENQVVVKFRNSGERALIAVNGIIMGIVEDDFVVVDNLNNEAQNVLRLVPLSETRRGEGVEINLNNIINEEPGQGEMIIKIPKVPDTGKAK